MSIQTIPTYPPPEDNPVCRCQGSPMRAFWCQAGHMTECHYPYDCKTAGCSHLYKYDYSLEEAAALQAQALERIKAGHMPPYKLDELGNITVDPEQAKHLPELLQKMLANSEEQNL